MTSKKRDTLTTTTPSPSRLTPRELALLSSAAPRSVARLGTNVLATLAPRAITSLRPIDALDVGVAVLRVLDRVDAEIALDTAEAQLAGGR